VTGRLGTLIAADPREVYYTNRGMFLEYTFVDLLPQYPLGAGLGRWGMLSNYFGEFNRWGPPIWVEVQWTGWLIDGGVLLMLAYGAALWLAVREAMRMAGREGSAADIELGKWAAVLVAYDVSIIASTFASCPFAGTLGIDFWLLNVTVFTASRRLARSGPAAELALPRGDGGTAP